MWLWIDLAIALVPVALLAVVVVSLFGSFKRVRRELKAVTGQVALLQRPAGR